MEKRSSSVFRIDEKVYYALGLVSIICLVILCFSFVHKKTCKNPDLQIIKSAAHYYTKSLISFKAETRVGVRFQWDFGDSSDIDEKGSSVLHEFRSAGTYTVKVLVDGTCEQVIPVEIADAPIMKNPNLIPVIYFPDTALINQPVEFTDVSADATAWEWHFGKSKDVEHNSRKVSHSFSIAGHNEVYLKINGKPDRFTIRDIFILDPNALVESGNPNNGKSKRTEVAEPPLAQIKIKPDGPPMDQGGPPPPKAETPVVIKKVRDLSQVDMEGLLKKVVSGESKAEDFSVYLGGNLSINVMYNEDSMPFTKMCEKLREIKKESDIKYLSVMKIGKDTTTNCITYLNIIASRKGWLKRITN